MFDYLLQSIGILTTSLGSLWNGKPVDGGEALLGVYYPVNASIYSDIYPSNPNKHTKQITELFTELIQLFIDMRYLNEDQVHFPPYKEYPINLTHPARYGLTKDVVDIYQMIPYVHGEGNWNYGSDHGEFVGGGEFLADLRQVNPDEDMSETWAHAIIDPTYGISWRSHSDDIVSLEEKQAQMSWDAESGPYIKPWFAVLSDIGNHGSLMCLNTKNCR